MRMTVSSGSQNTDQHKGLISQNAAVCESDEDPHVQMFVDIPTTRNEFRKLTQTMNNETKNNVSLI